MQFLDTGYATGFLRLSVSGAIRASKDAYNRLELTIYWLCMLQFKVERRGHGPLLTDPTRHDPPQTKKVRPDP